ncbi:hypothetical protein GGF46_004747 [Coemansia sp. RSA 552]|nr:hypothetical protein GGF46_004747 [Coemansia sp. RSA 552]
MYGYRSSLNKAADDRHMDPGLSIDTHTAEPYARGGVRVPRTAPYRMGEAQAELEEIYGERLSPPARHSSRQLQDGSVPLRSSSIVSGTQAPRESPDRQQSGALSAIHSRGAQRGQAEVNPVTVTAWGVSEDRRAGGYASPTGPSDRRFRHDGPSSPLHGAVRQDHYATPNTAHRATISTVLAGGSHSAGPGRVVSGQYATPRGRNYTTGTPMARRLSPSEYDTFQEPSTATGFGLESQFTRPNYDDSSLYAHTPNRDVLYAPGPPRGRGAAPLSASAGLRSGAQNILTPDTPSVASFSVHTRRHVRGNSISSPPTREQALEDTHRALTGGVRSGRGATMAAPSTEGRPGQRALAARTWYGPGPSDTRSDTYAWGSPHAVRSRAGSFAMGGRQAMGEQQRANGLAIDTGRPRHRASYTGSAYGSQTPSAIGSSQARGMRGSVLNRGGGDANSSFMSASARRARKTRTKSGKTPIRSNWYHKEEMLNEDDLKGQEFVSSDEEDFADEDRGYGDMVSQQKLIQKQQRTIFDLNMRCRMLSDAMAGKTDEPYMELVNNFEKTCASNRRANREIERLEGEVQDLKEQCGQLEDISANPPPCQLPHGMSEIDQQKFERQQVELDKALQDLAVERTVNNQRMLLLEDKDGQIREMQEDLTRERLDADSWHREVVELRAEANSSSRGSHATKTNGGEQSSSTSPVSPGSNGTRGRAGTTTTTSESMTLRAPSEISVGTRQQKTLERELKESERQRQKLQDELKQTGKRMREYQDQRRHLQTQMKHDRANRLALESKGDQTEIARLTNENDTLRDDCDSLRRQLDDAHAQAAIAAVSAIDLGVDDDDDADSQDISGNTAQRAEIAKLKLECRDLQAQTRMHEETTRRLTEELDKSRDSMHRLCHDYLRPNLRELTVGPVQADSVDEHVRRWSQLKVVVPTEDDTPTKNGRGNGRFSGDTSRSLGLSRD